MTLGPVGGSGAWTSPRNWTSMPSTTGSAAAASAAESSNRTGWSGRGGGDLDAELRRLAEGA
jgi:hypothetical protein